MKFRRTIEYGSGRPRRTVEVLQMPEQETTIVFDPEHEITSKVREQLATFATDAGDMDTATHARFIFLTLFPKRKSEIELNPARRQQHQERFLQLKQKEIKNMWSASTTAENIATEIMLNIFVKFGFPCKVRIWETSNSYAEADSSELK